MPIEPIQEPSRKTYSCMMYTDRKELAYGPTNYQIMMPNGPPVFRRDFGPLDDSNPLGYRQWNHQHWNPC